MARRSFQSRRSGPRPNRAWASTTTHTSIITLPAATKVLISSFALISAGVDLTILRTVGRFTVSSDQSGAVEQQIGAWGCIIVTDRAIAAGVASVPGPFTDAADDGWFVNQMFNWSSDRAVGNSALFEFDSKAKRIFGTGSEIAVVAENAHASQGLLIQINFRMLTQVRGTR